MATTINSKPSTWPMVPLESICEVGAGNGAPQGDAYFSGGIHPFVRMQDVGRLTTPYLGATVDKLNDRAVEKHRLRLWPANSLLIPKSGASVALNKRALLREPSYVVSHLAVLVPGKLIDPRFLYYLSCTLDMMRLALDPGYPSLRTSDLARLRIPLPPLSEQQRIVEILQEAEEIRRLRAEVEAKTAELIPAIFADTFGDLYFGKSPFPVQPLSSIGELDRGKSKHRPRDEPSLYGGPYPFLQTGDVAQANGWITRFSQAYSDKGLEQSRLWPKDTLAITIAANIGSTAILTFDACFPDSVVGFTPSTGTSVEYVRWWLLGYQKKLETQAPQGAQKNINLEVLRAIQIPVPPSELQLRFKKAIQNLREQLDATSAGAKSFATLSTSLSAHAFSGELTANWREAHAETLATEARERDAALKQAGATISRSRRATIQEMEQIFEQRTDGIYSDLNREQRDLLFQIQRRDKVLYVDYFSAESLSKSLDGPLRRNPQAIEGHLAVFAARGLIIPVSREEQTENTGEFVFGNAYRLPLRDRADSLTDEEGNILTTEDGDELTTEGVIGDASRGRELERLAAQLEKERYLK